MKKKYCDCGKLATEHFSFYCNGVERSLSMCSECSKKDPDRFSRTVQEVLDEAKPNVQIEVSK